MCKAPKVPAPTSNPDEKPEFLRNRVLDRALSGAGMVASLRTGRSSLRIPLGSAGRVPGTTLTTPPPVTPTPPGIRPIGGGGVGILPRTTGGRLDVR